MGAIKLTKSTSPSEHALGQVYESSATNRKKSLSKSGLCINHLAIFSPGRGHVLFPPMA